MTDNIDAESLVNEYYEKFTPYNNFKSRSGQIKQRYRHKYLNFLLSKKLPLIWDLFCEIRVQRTVYEILIMQNVIKEDVSLGVFVLWFERTFNKEIVKEMRLNSLVKYSLDAALKGRRVSDNKIESINNKSEKNQNIHSKQTNTTISTNNQISTTNKPASTTSSNQINHLPDKVVNGVEVPITRSKDYCPAAIYPEHLYHFTSEDSRYPQFFPDSVSTDGKKIKWRHKVDFLLIDDDGYLYEPTSQMPVPFNMQPTRNVNLFQDHRESRFYNLENIKHIAEEYFAKNKQLFKGRKV